VSVAGRSKAHASLHTDAPCLQIRQASTRRLHRLRVRHCAPRTPADLAALHQLSAPCVPYLPRFSWCPTCLCRSCPATQRAHAARRLYFSPTLHAQSATLPFSRNPHSWRPRTPEAFARQHALAAEREGCAMRSDSVQG
jgi:hypothetical protein